VVASASAKLHGVVSFRYNVTFVRRETILK
jgi:hypothetical protein